MSYSTTVTPPLGSDPLDTNGANNAVTDLFEWDPTEPVATRPLYWQPRTAEGNFSLFYTHDGNKNVSEAVFYQRARGVAAYYEYAPFGEVTVQSRGNAWGSLDLSELNPWRFSSEYADDMLGLTYYNYRHYDPVSGRWMSRDAAEEYASDLLYGYCRNNINQLDLRGNESYDLLGGIASALESILPTSGGRDFSGKIGEIPALGGIAIVHLNASVEVSQCCYKGEKGAMYSFRGGVEAFLQWGRKIERRKVGGAITDKNGNTRFLPEMDYSGYVPNGKGYRDRNWHVDGFETIPACPQERVQVQWWSVKAFLRGSIGVGFGVQGSVEYTVTENGFDPKSIMDRFDASASGAWGVYGGTLEFGINGSMALLGRIYP